MAIKLTNGAEFLHIPKTGGTWVSDILEELNLISEEIGGDKHADYDRVLNWKRLRPLSGFKIMKEDVCHRLSRIAPNYVHPRVDPSPYHPPIRFCFVRHPLSWYESWWKYMMGRGWHDWGKANDARKWHPNTILNGLGSDDFNQFVRNVVKKRPGYVSELYFSYTKPGIDFIGKTESLYEDFARILRLLDVSFEEDRVLGAPRRNVSKKPEFPLEWDPDLRRTVLLLELPALIHFGYLSEHLDEMGAAGLATEAFAPSSALQALSLRSPSE